MCAIGSSQDIISQVLHQYHTYSLPYSQYTYNILLNKYALEGKTTEAFSIIDQMTNAHIVVDTVTLNTLLKLFINKSDVSGAKKVTFI
jgi:pentatricopeptide repeat protein